MRLASMTIVAVTAASALAGSTSRVSVDSGGRQANGSSYGPAISGDGRFIAFASEATNLLSRSIPIGPKEITDTYGVTDVFVHDTVTHAIERVSVSSGGAEGNRESDWPALSDNDRFVAFQSSATNLVPGDTNGVKDVFVHDRLLQITVRVSVNDLGAEANAPSFAPAISGDGRYVAFRSDATNLVAADTNGVADIFVHDLVNATTVRVSVGPSGLEANDTTWVCSLSRSGRWCSFGSDASNLVPNDQNFATDVFVHDRDPDGNGMFDEGNGITVLASVDSSGIQGKARSASSTISADGRFVSFSSLAQLSPDDGRFQDEDVYVRDLVGGTTELITRSPTGGFDEGYYPALSRDGSTVAFNTYDAYVPEDRNGSLDVYTFDRSTASYTLVSVASDGSLTMGPAGGAALSSDGSLIAFNSFAPDIVPGDTNGETDVFLRDQSCPEPLAQTYGTGWPGTLGVPVLVAQSGPTLCSPLALALSSSRMSPTPAIVIVGLAPASTPTSLGGTLLVAPQIFLPVSLDATGLVLSFQVPCDASLCGLAPYLQALEVDAGASRGVSFTAGLKLVFGN